MDVLNLVTSADSPFFHQQVSILTRQGATCTTVPVPGCHEAGEDGANRSVVDYVRFYPRVLRRSLEGHDLIHANSGLTGPAAVAQPGRPLVLSLWGTELTNRYASVSKTCARLSDGVIVMSPEMARLYGRDCWIVPHGVDVRRFSPRGVESARAELGWDQDATHVLFPYPPEREIKNYPRAERIVGQLSDRVNGQIHLQTAVDVPHERMPTYMNAADALLLTSEWEGSPNVVKEALACNLPVVSTPVGDVRRRLRNATASTVGETDAALTAGLEDAVRGDVDPSGCEAVREVSLRRMGERIRAIYARTLANDGRAVPMSASAVTLARYDAERDEVLDRSLPVPAMA